MKSLPHFWTIYFLALCQITFAFRFVPFRTGVKLSGRKMKYCLGSNLEEREMDPHAVTTNDRIVITGLAEQEDEFSLNILFEEQKWKSIVVAGDNIDSLRRKLLSRTAKYSGLYDNLEFQRLDFANTDDVQSVLTDASAWIAFNLPRQMVSPLSKLALRQKIPRVLFTVRLSKEEIQSQAALPEFEEAIHLFEANQAYFTGIRHGDIIPGEEHLPYSIVNSSYAPELSYVHRGVLGRVAAELLHLRASCNQECGLSSSTVFAKTFLEMLRSAGASSSDEVALMFDGAYQNILAESYQDSSLLSQQIQSLSNPIDPSRAAEVPPEKVPFEKYSKADLKRVLYVSKPMRLEKSPYYLYASVEKFSEEDYLQEEIEQLQRSDAYARGELDNALDRNRPLSLVSTGKEAMFNDRVEDPVLEQRAVEKFLSKIWFHFQKKSQSREYMFSMSRGEFLQQFFYQGRALYRRMQRIEELEHYRHRFQQEASLLSINSYQDEKANLLSQLSSIQQKQLLQHQSLYDLWVQYLSILLLTTTKEVRQKYQKSFAGLSPTQQTMMLRKVANHLRRQCQLPESNLIYDPADVELMIPRLRQLSEYRGIIGTPDLPLFLQEEFGKLLETIPALKGANEKLRYAIETIQKQQVSRYEDNSLKNRLIDANDEVVFIDRRQWRDPDPNSVLHPYFVNHEQRLDEDNY